MFLKSFACTAYFNTCIVHQQHKTPTTSREKWWIIRRILNGKYRQFHIVCVAWVSLHSYPFWKFILQLLRCFTLATRTLFLLCARTTYYTLHTHTDTHTPKIYQPNRIVHFVDNSLWCYVRSIDVNMRDMKAVTIISFHVAYNRRKTLWNEWVWSARVSWIYVWK